MNTWVINASPLILLGKIDRLALLEQLQPYFVIPDSVKAEIVAGPEGDAARCFFEFV
jgi:predicted nucleic acid-binding protein